MPFTPDPNLVEQHRLWLAKFDAQYLRNWEKLLNTQPEAGMCEAAFRKILEANGCEVEPSEDVTGTNPSPDFRCRLGDQAFYVEVACLRIETVTAKTNLPHKPSGAGHHRLLNNLIFEAVRRKMRQCVDLDAPALVAVGTFHFASSIIHLDKLHLGWLLTGKIGVSFAYDESKGEATGEPETITSLEDAAFVRPDDDGWLETARHPVSGLLVAGLGTEKWRVFALLHPEPMRPFDRKLLPGIEFCRLKDGYRSGQLSTEWI